jgi:peptide/nickel transport system permease protein
MRFVIRRLTYGLCVVFGVSVTVFLVTQVIGDPARLMLPIGASQEQYDSLNASLGYDDPLWIQFLRFLKNLVTLDFGDSIWQRVPVAGLVFDRLPATLHLVAVGLILSAVIFIPLGIIASLRPGTLLDRLIVTVSLVGVSMPQFWLGAVLILIFAVQLGWLPTSGSGTWQHIVLPSVTLALTSGARIAQITRTALLDQVNAPYVAALRARGFSMSSILTKHVLRNSLLPILTMFFWELSFAIAGHVVIIETVFAWPGMGQLIIQAVERRDFVLLQGAVVIAALLVILTNIVADLVYKAVDPRVELN